MCVDPEQSGANSGYVILELVLLASISFSCSIILGCDHMYARCVVLMFLDWGRITWRRRRKQLQDERQTSLLLTIANVHILIRWHRDAESIDSS
jgi:hypothetical protein